MKINRLPHNPVITPAMLAEEVGANINGPSLVRVPDWLPGKLGNYYLYFAHHQGQFIRLAYADRLVGPWQIYQPGTLQLDQTPCIYHIASPDLHIDHRRRRLIMYYHGPVPSERITAADRLSQNHPILGNQRSFVATSGDGINFVSGDEVLGPSYFRVFEWAGYIYALGMPGIFYRSRDGLSGFERGPELFSPAMRHTAVLRREHTLYVFYSNAGDCPEHILLSTIDLRPDWHEWQETPAISVLQPETDYEGGNLPLEPSERGSIHERVRQLRDPGIYVEGERTYLLYAIAGESGLAIAEILDLNQ